MKPSVLNSTDYVFLIDNETFSNSYQTGKSTFGHSHEYPNNKYYYTENNQALESDSENYLPYGLTAIQKSPIHLLQTQYHCKVMLHYSFSIVPETSYWPSEETQRIPLKTALRVLFHLCAEHLSYRRRSQTISCVFN